MTVSRIVSIKELPNKQISDTSLFLHNTNDSESKDKNVSVAQVREYLVKPEADRAKKAEADEKAERIKAIEEEAKARIDAIAQEAQERITAITAERERAESAEKTEKDERVQAVFEEATEREKADTALQSAIDTEAENRENADNALSSRLDDTNDKIETETSERKADVANLADNLDKENARALEAESALQTAIDTEAEKRESANTAMTDKLDAMQETIDAIPFTEEGLSKAVTNAITDGTTRRIYGTYGLLGGAAQASARTMSGVVDEVAMKGGICGGSFCTEAGAWYNFLYIPHRIGMTENGASDNHNFGTCLFFDMTSDTSSMWIMHRSGGKNFPARKVL